MADSGDDLGEGGEEVVGGHFVLRHPDRLVHLASPQRWLYVVCIRVLYSYTYIIRNIFQPCFFQRRKSQIDNIQLRHSDLTWIRNQRDQWTGHPVYIYK